MDERTIEYDIIAERYRYEYGDYRFEYIDKDHMVIRFTNPEPDTSLIRGWKFHIAIDASRDTAVIKEALQHLAPIMMEYELKFFKFLKVSRDPGDLENEDHEKGRQITIYAELNPELSLERWKALFNSLTDKLMEQGISPGIRNPVCRAVTGSQYVSYRNDASPTGGYMACSSIYKDRDIPVEKRYNFGNIADPFTELKVSVANQPEARAYEFLPLPPEPEENEPCCSCVFW